MEINPLQVWGEQIRQIARSDGWPEHLHSMPRQNALALVREYGQLPSAGGYDQSPVENAVLRMQQEVRVCVLVCKLVAMYGRSDQDKLFRRWVLGDHPRDIAASYNQVEGSVANRLSILRREVSLAFFALLPQLALPGGSASPERVPGGSASPERVPGGSASSDRPVGRPVSASSEGSSSGSGEGPATPRTGKKRGRPRKDRTSGAAAVRGAA